jgi:superfamily II DNA/RNA helicase
VLEEVVTKKMGYNQPTPIQAYTIPAVLSGSDVIAIAQTGSFNAFLYLSSHTNINNQALARLPPT